MMWIAIGFGAAAVSVLVGALAAFILHRREKVRRPPCVHGRNMWGGT